MKPEPTTTAVRGARSSIQASMATASWMERTGKTPGVPTPSMGGITGEAPVARRRTSQVSVDSSPVSRSRTVRVRVFASAETTSWRVRTVMRYFSANHSGPRGRRVVTSSNSPPTK